MIGPIANTNKRDAADNDTKSATRIVLHASLVDFSTAYEKDLPTLSSSLNFSYVTIYESAARPIDTIIPATPASVKVNP